MFDSSFINASKSILDGSNVIIGVGNRGAKGPWPLLNLRPLHRIVIIAIENHFCLVKWPPLISVVSSTSECDGCEKWYHIYCLNLTYKKLPKKFFAIIVNSFFVIIVDSLLAMLYVIIPYM